MMRSSRRTCVEWVTERASNWLIFFETLSFWAVDFLNFWLSRYSTYDFRADFDFWFFTLTFDFLDFWHRPHRSFRVHENLFHLARIYCHFATLPVSSITLLLGYCFKLEKHEINVTILAYITFYGRFQTLIYYLRKLLRNFRKCLEKNSG